MDLNQALAGMSPHTQRMYKRFIHAYFEFAKVEESPLNLQIATIKNWLAAYKQSGRGLSTIEGGRCALSWYASHAADLDLISYETAARIGKLKLPRAESGSRAKTWLTPREVSHLMSILKSDSTPAGRRNYALIALLVFTGLRRGEAAQLKWCDMEVIPAGLTLRVHGKGSKFRIVKMPQIVADALDAWQKGHPFADSTSAAIFSRVRQNGFIQIEGMSAENIWQLVRACARKAGIIRKLSPHDLRRTFARGAYEAGASFELIRQSMGHSDVSMTAHYVNAQLELTHAATDVWAEAVKNG